MMNSTETNPIPAEQTTLMFNSPGAQSKMTRLRAAGVLLAGAIGLQVLMLAAVAVPQLITLNTGKTVVLKTRTYDPYDPFRGEYVRFTCDVAAVKTTEHFEKDQTVYLLLKRGTPYWTQVKICRELPACGADEAAIRAKILYSWDNNATVSLGIEQFFVPQGKSAEITAQGSPDVEVSVDSSGNAAIRRLLRNGKEI